VLGGLCGRTLGVLGGRTTARATRTQVE